MSDVEIRFTGDAADAEQATAAIDAALEQIERLADQVSRALGNIEIGGGQVAAFVADTSMMSAALARLERQANDTRRSVSEVSRFQPSSMIEAAVTGQAMNEIRRVFMAGQGGNYGTAFTSSGYASSVVGPSPTDMSLGPYGTGPDPRRSTRFFNDIPDPINARYGNQGILSSHSDRGRGGLLGMLLGAASDGEGGGSIFDRFGRGGGGGGGGRGGGRYDVPGPNILAGILPGGSRARPAALAAVGLGAVATAPELGAPIIGLLSQLPVMAVTGATALGALALAFQGVGAAISGNVKEYNDLLPVQQQFVLMVRGLEPFLDKLKQTAAGAVMPGVTQGLASFLNPMARGNINNAVGTIGGAIGGQASQWGSFFGSASMQTMFHELTGTGAGVLANVSKTLMNLADAFIRIGDAAQPLTKWFGDLVVHATELIDKFVIGKQTTGELGQFFTGLENPIRLVGRAIGDIVKVVFDLASILSGAGTAALTGLVELLDGLHSWLQKNHDALAEFATVLVATVIGAIKDLVAVVSPAVTGLASLAGAFASFADSLGGIPAAIGAVVGALVLMAGNPKIVALLAAMTALGYLVKAVSPGGADSFGGTMPGGTTNTADITGKRLTNAEEVLSLRKKGWSDERIQAYLIGDTKAQKGLPQFGKGSSGDIAMASAFTDANALTVGQGSASGVMPATSEAGNPSSTLLQGPHHTDGFPGSGKTAVDIAATVGAPVLAPEDGQVTRDSGHAPATSGTANINGYSLYFAGVSGTNYFMTHMSWVAKPGMYKKGDKIGIVAAHTQGGAHIHVDYSPPLQFMGGPSANTPSWAPGTVPTGPGKGQLPLDMQISTAKALGAYTQSPTSAHLAAYRHQLQAEAAYLKAKEPSLDGQDLLDAVNEFNSIMATLASLSKKAKQGIAKAGTKLSARNAGSSILSLIGMALGPTSGLGVGVSSPSDIVTADPLGAAHSHLDSSLKAWRTQIQAFEKELREKTISNDAVSTIRARMATIRADVTTALSQIKDAAAQQAANFKSVWASAVQSFDDAFREQTSDILANPEKYPALLPLSAALADLQNTHTQEQLQKALKDAQKQLANALAGTDPSSALSAARQKLSQDALAHALDVAQSFVLGGVPMDMTDKIIKDMQEALAATGPDPQAVLDAQQSVADAEYNIKVDGLTKEAAAEQSAFQKSRQDLLKHLDATLALWETFYAKQGMKASEALAALNALLKKLGFTPITDPFNPSTGGFGTPGGGGIDKPPGTPGDANVPGGSSGDTSLGPGASTLPRFGAPVMMAAGGLITSPHYLVDTHGVVKGMVGEKTPELVVPVSTGGAVRGARTTAAAAGGDGVTVNVQFADGMEWLAQFVDVRVRKNTGPISRALGKSADDRRRALRY